MTYATRLASFTSWPHTCPSASAVASAGFHQEHDPSFPVPDLAVCSLCGLDPCEWKNEPDDPFDFHATRSPKCPFVRATQQKKKRNKKTRQQYKRREKTQHTSSSKAITVNNIGLLSIILRHTATSMHREVFICLDKTLMHLLASRLHQPPVQALLLILLAQSVTQHVGIPPYARQAEDMEATGQG